MENQSVANKKARLIIKQNIFGALSTADEKGTPWVAPINYSYDKDYNFYLFSSKKSRHMQNIVKNKYVALAIYDSTARGDDVDGVQLEGTAKVLSEIALIKEFGHILKIKEGLKKKYGLKDYMGISLMRIAKITPKRVYKFDRTSIPGKDRRQEVFLK